MLTVDQYAYIRIAHRVYGKGIREIARETGHSRNTIKKALQEEYGGYGARRRQSYPSLGPYLGTIDGWLKEDRDRPRKQRHTAVRIYNRLRRECGFEGGESTVRRYVREARLRLGVATPQVFVPLEAELGMEAEVDWGGCRAVVAGECVKLKMFCMRSKGSGKPFVRCYPCERQQALFEGHMEAFGFYGGVFRHLIYDNLSTAVEKVLKGKERKLQESFERFRAYYNFTPRFCNPGEAHEKGGVEGLVGYARRNFLVPMPRVESLEALNAQLLAECAAYGDHRIAGRDKAVKELFEEEKGHLLPLPELPFSNLDTASGKVDKYSTVMVEKNRYSVPPRFAGLRVRVVLSVGRVELFYGSQRIATHPRHYGSNKWQLDPMHYLELLRRRPQAFAGARPIRQWRAGWPPSLERLLERFCEAQGENHGIKDFIGVLMLFGEHEPKEVLEAVEAAVRAGVSSKEAVAHLLLKNSRTEHDFRPGPLGTWPTLPPPDVSVYARIGALP
jgi:transposase